MENEKNLNEMSIDELIDVILKNPEKMDEVFRATDDLQELYDALESELFPSEIVFDDAEMNQNLIIQQALDKLSKNYLYEELDYEDIESYEEQPSLTDEDLREADEELEEFYAEHSEEDDRPDSQIPEGMSQEEYLETMGVSINEFGEIIRPNNQTKPDKELMDWLNSGNSSPLKKRKEQLAKLEKEALTISKAEALIDRQNAKEGQNRGE